ncbi:MAG: hypothetical protein QOH41_1091 [Blastocatellia bacterium]|nr:hypothetical protein [Blastocatellia bacterium]
MSANACPRCGALNSGAARFCMKCRNPLQPTEPLPKSDLGTAVSKALVRNLIIIAIAFIVIFCGLAFLFLLIFLIAHGL